jgi:hypothetical protein
MQRTKGGRVGGRASAHGLRLALVLLLSALAGCTCPGDDTATVQLAPRTATFLGADDFEGEFTAREGKAEFGGEAIYLGRVVFLHLARAEVQSVLPADLKLAQNTSGSLPDVHPVVLVFGHQTDTKLVYPFWTADVGEDYRELILLVPFVQRAGHSRWHNYVVRIYLEDFWAMLLGNQHYGLQKLLATFSETDADFGVIRDSVAVFASESAPSAAWQDDAAAATTLANYQQMKQILSMPILGTLTMVLGKPYVCSYFEWDFTGARVRPISTKSQFLQAFTTGMSSWVNLGILQSVPDGAWQLEKFRWRMAYPPFACEF